MHYQLPASADTYVHRCGRTARGLEGEGIAIAIATPKESARFQALLKALGRSEAPQEFQVVGAGRVPWRVAKGGGGWGGAAVCMEMRVW